MQEGDGNYTTSEPPTANATIARFVVIGGAPPATPSNRSTSSKSYLCEGAPASAAVTGRRPSYQGHAESPDSSTLLSVLLAPKQRGPSLCACMHMRLNPSSIMLVLHRTDTSVFQAMLSALRMRLLRKSASRADIGRQPACGSEPWHAGLLAERLHRRQQCPGCGRLNRKSAYDVMSCEHMVPPRHIQAGQP